jgi:hypothetical protein
MRARRVVLIRPALTTSGGALKWLLPQPGQRYPWIILIIFLSSMGGSSRKRDILLMLFLQPAENENRKCQLKYYQYHELVVKQFGDLPLPCQTISELH